LIHKEDLIRKNFNDIAHYKKLINRRKRKPSSPSDQSQPPPLKKSKSSPSKTPQKKTFAAASATTPVATKKPANKDLKKHVEVFLKSIEEVQLDVNSPDSQQQFNKFKSDLTRDLAALLSLFHDSLSK
jgi:hypothetical protein